MNLLVRTLQIAGSVFFVHFDHNTFDFATSARQNASNRVALFHGRFFVFIFGIVRIRVRISFLIVFVRVGIGVVFESEFRPGDRFHRIAVAGGSAGGHLALMVGFTTGMAGLEPDAPYPGVSSAVRCIIDMYGPTNLLTRKDIAKDGTPSATRRLMGKSLDYFGAKDEEDPVLKLASPVTHVRRDVPPVMVLHGRADTTVDYHQSDELVRILKEKGAKHEYLLIDGVGHTFAWENWGKKKMERDLRPVALAFLAKHLGN